jgi:hypothetical protein
VAERARSKPQLATRRPFASAACADRDRLMMKLQAGRRCPHWQSHHMRGAPWNRAPATPEKAAVVASHRDTAILEVSSCTRQMPRSCLIRQLPAPPHLRIQRQLCTHHAPR